MATSDRVQEPPLLAMSSSDDEGSRSLSVPASLGQAGSPQMRVHHEAREAGPDVAQPVVSVTNQVPAALQVYYAVCQQHGTEPLGSVCTALAFHVTQLQFEASTSARDLIVLTHILQYNATITTLDFSRCCIGNHGCYPLAAILSSNRA